MHQASGGRVRARSFALLLGMGWLAVLGCRTGDLVAQYQASAASTATRTATATRTTVRPTFTPIPPTATLVVRPTIAAAPPNFPPPTLPALSVGATPTRTRMAQASRAATQPPAPTADPYQGYYYRVIKNVCVTAPNTRAEGMVYDNGVPENGVIVRVANGDGGDPVIDDYVTGLDPQSDKKHTSPDWTGKYRLGIAEGLQMAGNWWVFIIDNKGQKISVGAYFNTHDTNGCNTAYIDFAH